MRYSPLYYNDLKNAKENIIGIDGLTDRSVMITGVTGLIGSAIADVLLVLKDIEKNNIKLFFAAREAKKVQKRFEEHSEGSDYHYVKYDALNPIKAPETVDFFIHCAGIANTVEYAKNPCGVISVAISGCENALKYISSNKKGRMLYISSSEVYGDNTTGGPFKENDYGSRDILNPRSCYPSAKVMAETMCSAFHLQYGVDVVIARPGHVYGPTAVDTDQRASSQFPRDVINEQVIHMKSKGEQLRSYCYAIDCATALLTIMLRGKTAEAYNVSNERSNVTIHEMAEAFAKAGNAELVMEGATEKEKAGYNLMNMSALDNTKLKDLGWNGAFDMKTGAIRTIECLRYQGMDGGE